MHRFIKAIIAFIAKSGHMVACVVVITLSLFPRPTTAEMIQLEPQGGVYVVPVRVNGILTLPFVIDSGAADVAIPGDVFLTLLRTGTVKRGDYVGKQTYVLADGSKLPSDRFILRELRVGDRVIRNVIAHVGNVKGDPLLGQSFLSKLAAWSIDNQRHALVLRDGEATGDQQQALVGVPTPMPLLQAVPVPVRSTPPATPGLASGGYGAIAYDQNSGKLGASFDQPTPSQANELALRQCASAECRVHPVEPKGCGALAMSDKDKAWGGADRETLEKAKGEAVAHCQTHTQTGKCAVRVSGCNR